MCHSVVSSRRRFAAVIALALLPAFCQAALTKAEMLELLSAGMKPESVEREAVGGPVTLDRHYSLAPYSQAAEEMAGSALIDDPELIEAWIKWHQRMPLFIHQVSVVEAEEMVSKKVRESLDRGPAEFRVSQLVEKVQQYHRDGLKKVEGILDRTLENAVLTEEQFYYVVGADANWSNTRLRQLRQRFLALEVQNHPEGLMVDEAMNAMNSLPGDRQSPAKRAIVLMLSNRLMSRNMSEREVLIAHSTLIHSDRLEMLELACVAFAKQSYLFSSQRDPLFELWWNIAKVDVNEANFLNYRRALADSTLSAVARNNISIDSIAGQFFESQRAQAELFVISPMWKLIKERSAAQQIMLNSLEDLLDNTPKGEAQEIANRFKMLAQCDRIQPEFFGRYRELLNRFRNQSYRPSFNSLELGEMAQLKRHYSLITQARLWCAGRIAGTPVVPAK